MMGMHNSPAVLVVDDDQEHCLALTKIFERAGYRARRACDGQEALAMLLDWPADLVITDLRMPRTDGMELLRSIRALSPSIAVVVLTAFGEWTTYMDAMETGAVDYLNKPVRRDEILLVARKALSRRGVRAPDARGPQGQTTSSKSETEAA